MRLPLAALFALVLLWQAPARADSDVFPPRLTGLQGARSAGMGGAARAVGASNEALYLNPAGLAVGQRFQLDLEGAQDFGSPATTFGLSLADSTAGMVAAGVAVNRFLSGPEGDRSAITVFHLGVAAALSPNIALGISGKFLHLSDVTRKNGVTPDVGLILHFEPIAFGFVAYNVVDIHSLEAPRQYALAFALGSTDGLLLALDALADTASTDKTTFAFHGGLSYQLFSMLTVRAGYLEDRIRLGRAITGGVGLALPGEGLALNVAYEHELGGSNPVRVLSVGLSLLLARYFQ